MGEARQLNFVFAVTDEVPNIVIEIDQPVSSIEIAQSDKYTAVYVKKSIEKTIPAFLLSRLQYKQEPLSTTNHGYQFLPAVSNGL
jgi:hypothetical protein